MYNFRIPLRLNMKMMNISALYRALRTGGGVLSINKAKETERYGHVDVQGYRKRWTGFETAIT